MKTRTSPLRTALDALRTSPLRTALDALRATPAPMHVMGCISGAYFILGGMFVAYVVALTIAHALEPANKG